MTRNECNQRWRAKNKAVSQAQRYKKKIRMQAYRHVEIPQGQKCEICKKRLAVERHHPDYFQPLLIIFVCPDCHRKG